MKRILPPKTGHVASGNGWRYWCNGCRMSGYAVLEEDAKRQAAKHQAKCPPEDEQ